MRSRRFTAGKPIELNEEGTRRGKVAINPGSINAAKHRARMHRVVHNGMPEKRPFLGWDGEGITHPGDKQQSYVLFGCSPNEYISGKSLSTRQIFDFIIEIGKKYGYSVVHVSFAFNYDVNMIIKDLPMPILQRLSKAKATWWGDFRIEWLPRKWFRLTKNWIDEWGTPQKTVVTIYDVFTFFASSFVKVCEQYLDGEDIEIVRRGKLMRDEFTWEQFETVVLPYWQSEIKLIAKVMERYRDVLYGAEMYITQWYGPGAVASYVLKKHGIADHLTRDLPDEVIQASAHAYAGGRFELFQAGHYEGTVYSYDINSAYPYALTKVRSVAPQYGKWVHHDEVDRTKPISSNMALYHVVYKGKSRFGQRRFFNYMYPLFYRNKGGNISFPITVEGWYWDPEAALIWDDPDAEIVESWEFETVEDVYPFTYIQEYFEKRKQLKKEKNPAQLGLKLGMNSAYGKLAQRIGWDEKNMRPPTWHQLEYAGWITSYTRAMIYRAASVADAQGGLIACETDGIYSKVPLDDILDIGSDLGQWERDVYEGITYVQSGFYWKKSGGKWTAKYRGLDPDSVSHDRMLTFFDGIGGAECPECLRIHTLALKPSEAIESEHTCKYRARTHRFVGIGAALMTKEKLDNWRVWADEEKVFRPAHSEGKRKHELSTCRMCRQGHTFAEGMHPLVISQPGSEGMSVEHNLPWRTGSLTMGQENNDMMDRFGDVETGYEADELN